jgi:hypothetical protein
MNVSESSSDATKREDLARIELTLVGSIKLMKRTRRELQRQRRKSHPERANHDRRSVN